MSTSRAPDAAPRTALEQILAPNLFQQERGHSRLVRIDERSVLGVGGEDHRGDRRTQSRQLPAQVHPAPVGQSDVDHGDVDRQATGQEIPGGGQRLRVGHDVDVPLSRQQFRQTASNDLMVVDEETPDAHRLSLSLPRAGHRIAMCGGASDRC